LQQTPLDSFQPEGPHGPKALRNPVKLKSVANISDGAAWDATWQSKQFSCDICFKTFSNKKSLQNHAGIHKGKTTCTVCNTVFSTTSNLNFHMRKIHNTLVYELDQ
jgi:hypothetical protein